MALKKSVRDSLNLFQKIISKGFISSSEIYTLLMRYDAEKDAFEMTGAKPSWEK